MAPSLGPLKKILKGSRGYLRFLALDDFFLRLITWDGWRLPEFDEPLAIFADGFFLATNFDFFAEAGALTWAGAGFGATGLAKAGLVATGEATMAGAAMTGGAIGLAESGAALAPSGANGICGAPPKPSIA